MSQEIIRRKFFLNFSMKAFSRKHFQIKTALIGKTNMVSIEWTDLKNIHIIFAIHALYLFLSLHKSILCFINNLFKWTDNAVFK